MSEGKEGTESKEAGKLFVVSAPSGAGKTSLVKALTESSPAIGVAVSHTTRPQRLEEENGVNYHFVSDDKFEAMKSGGEFLEWAHVFDHLYGTSTAAANKVLEAGQNLVLEIDWQGAQQIREAVPGTETIFIFPPSLKSLHDRLLSRAQDDTATVERRMASALEELSHYAEFDYLVVNDKFDEALAQIRAIVEGQGGDLAIDRQRPLLKDLIEDLLPQKMP